MIQKENPHRSGKKVGDYISIELTKNADALMCIIYAKYLVDKQNGKLEDDARYIGGSGEVAVYTQNGLTADETDTCLCELSRNGLIKATTANGIVVFSELLDPGISFMERRGIDKIRRILSKVSEWSVAVSGLIAAIAALK